MLRSCWALFASLLCVLVTAAAHAESSLPPTTVAPPPASPSSVDGTAPQPATDVDEDDDDETADPESVDDGEAESRTAGAGDSELRYSTDLSDADLERLFVAGAPELGSVSVGFADEGRMINAVTLPPGDAWEVMVPENAWGAQEVIDALVAAANAVRAKFPEVQKLRVNHISKKEGGYLRPHKSHQSGRDVDLGFFYKGNLAPTEVTGSRADAMSLPENWLLLRELLARADVQSILVDKKIRQRLHDYALSIGENPEWLGAVFGKIIQHARRHKDHFHVRFFAPRSQELGRRIQPLLAKRPDENLAIYRIRSGDTLGHIAQRFNSTVSMIQKANRMSNSFLRVSRTLVVPLRGPCTRCPLPPPVVVPERHVPPEPVMIAAPTVVAPSDSPVVLVEPAVDLGTSAELVENPKTANEPVPSQAAARQ